MQVTQAGDQVAIHYTGRLEDGTVFDHSQGQEPLAFEVGSPTIMPGLSQAVIGMQLGERKTVTLPPEEAYGPRWPGLEKHVPKPALPEGLQVGHLLQVEIENKPVIFWVTALDADGATLDPNHPLAGQTLIFDLELVTLMSAEKPA